MSIRPCFDLLRRAVAPVVVLLSVILGAASCDSGSGDGGSQIVDVARDIVFDISARDAAGAAETVGDVPAGSETDVPPPPECAVDNDCVTKLPTPTQCQVRSCDAGTCRLAGKEDGTPCDDGSDCTVFDHCTAGRCEGGQNTCSCESNADCAPFDDDDMCNGHLVCDTSALPYSCVIDRDSIVTCDTSNDTTCRQTDCDPGTGRCLEEIVNVGEPCNDDDPCTGNTTCDEDGECTGDEVCQCRSDADCLPFDTENLCDAVFFCDTAPAAPICRPKPGTEVRCSPAGNTQCRVNECQPSTGVCAMTNRPDGTQCNDGNGCTTGDSCQAGVCTSGATKDCDDDNPCTNDGCSPATGACLHQANSMSCENEYSCSLGDQCDQGSCRQGTTIHCDDADPCTLDTCVEPDGCVFTRLPELCPDPPEDTVQPPEDVVQPPQDVVQPPQDAVQPPEDVVQPPADVYTWPSWTEATFRVTSLGWGAPDLCWEYVANDPCVPMNGTVSNDLTARLAPGALQLTLLLRFEPLDVTAETGLVAFGVGSCDGDVCTLPAEGPVTNFGAPVFQTDGTCLASPELGAPCVGTEAAPITIPDLILPPAGGGHVNPPFALVDAQIYGRFGGDLDGIAAGVIRGFLATPTVEQTRTVLTGFGSADFGLLFENDPPTPAPTSHAGFQGWWVELEFTAERVSAQ